MIVSTTSAEGGEDEIPSGSAADGMKVKFLVKHILQKEQIAHIVKKGLW